MEFQDFAVDFIQWIQERIGNINKVESISTGCNSFIFVVHGADTLVVKAPNSDYSRNAIKREIRVLDALRNCGIPVPEAELVLDYEVMSLFPGMTGAEILADESLSREEKLEFCRVLGKVLRRIHSLNVSLPPLRVDGEKLYQTTIEWAVDHLNYIQSRIKDASDEDLSILQKQVQLAEDSTKWVIEPLSFLHGDAMLPNFLFSKKDSTWELQAVLDWGDAGYGDKRYDLASIQWSIEHNAKATDPIELQEAFLESYGGTTQEYVDLIGMDFYDLYDAICYNNE
jgi:aminoglycoside phosphotransferase (APT) family kinase protein